MKKKLSVEKSLNESMNSFSPKVFTFLRDWVFIFFLCIIIALSQTRGFCAKTRVMVERITFGRFGFKYQRAEKIS